MTENIRWQKISDVGKYEMAENIRCQKISDVGKYQMSDALLFSRDCIHIMFYTLYSSNSTQHINSVIREI